MNRRDILKGAVAGASAINAPAQHTHHGVPGATAAAAAAAPQAWKPLLFDPHQNETVVVLTDLIIPATDTPGAKQAKVNEHIDLLLHDGPPERRNEFLWGLAWLDGYAMRSHRQPFVRCSPSDQAAILKSLDGAVSADLKPGAEFFRAIKGLTVAGYYTTKIGMDELNKGGIPASFGCPHGGKHA